TRSASPTLKPPVRDPLKSVPPAAALAIWSTYTLPGSASAGLAARASAALTATKAASIVGRTRRGPRSDAGPGMGIMGELPAGRLASPSSLGRYERPLALVPVGTSLCA